MVLTSGGVVTDVIITNPGSGYTSAPSAVGRVAHALPRAPETPITAEDMQADDLLPGLKLTIKHTCVYLASPGAPETPITAVGRIAHVSPGAPETPVIALEPRPNRDWAEEKTLADFRRVFADERKWKSLGFGRTEG